MTAVETDDLALSPQELEAFAWCRERTEQIERELAERATEAKPEPKEPEVETFDIERFVPWDFRTCARLRMWFGLGTRDGVTDSAHRPLWLWRRSLLWCLTNWPRFRMMLWVLRSGDVGKEMYEARSEVCDRCEDLKIGRDGNAYCGSCGCLDWSKSQLVRKNRCRLNHCPRRLHAGGYIKLITARWPNRKESGKAPRRGCGAASNG